MSVAAAVLAVVAAGAAQPPQWTSTGPEGGEVWSLASSPAAPDTVYAGTSGGVYKSTDFGTTWRRRSTGLPYAWNAVAVDSQNAQRVFAWADGLRMSLDGGRHWRLRGRAPNAMGEVRRIVVAPSAPRTLYAWSGGWSLPALWRSTNAGRSWTRSALPVQLGLDIAVDPLSAKRLYLATLMNPLPEGGGLVPGGVLVSADGGRTWRRSVSKADIHSLAVDPASATVYAGGGAGEIYRSVDRGEHWRIVARLDVRDRIVALAVDPTDRDVVYALTLEGVHRSTDRGVSWRLVGRRSFGLTRGWSWASHFATMRIHSEQSDRILLSSGDSGVWRSDDRGRSWAVDNSGRVATTIAVLAAHPRDPLVAYAVTGGQLWVTRDGGEAWQSVSGIRASDLAFDPRQPATMYAAGDGLLRSADGGRTWKTIRRGVAEQVIVDPARPSTLYVNTGRRIVKSTDGGGTWAGASTGLSDSNFTTTLAIDPRRPSTLYAIARVQGTTASLIFKTTNGGATWRDVYVVTDAELGSIAVDRRGVVYVDGLRSDDGGVTWANTSFPDGPLAIDSAHPGVVYAGDRDGAVYMTRNSGSTIQEAARLRWPVLELAVGAGASRLYVGTEGHGVFVARLPLAP